MKFNKKLYNTTVVQDKGKTNMKLYSKINMNVSKSNISTVHTEKAPNWQIEISDLFQ